MKPFALIALAASALVLSACQTDAQVLANEQANDTVHVQAWIGADDKLPRRLRAVFAADPLGLRHEMELSNWQLDPAVAPDAFASQKAQTAGRMAFAAPAPPPKGAKPIVKGAVPPATKVAPRTN